MHYVRLLSLLAAISGITTPALANALTDKQSQLTAAQGQASALQSQIAATAAATADARAVDKLVSDFMTFHAACVSQFTAATTALQKYLGDIEAAKIADQAEIDAITKRLSATVEAINNPQASVADARDLLQQAAAQVRQATVCTSPRLASKGAEIAVFIEINLTTPAQAYTNRLASLTLPTYLAPLAQSAHAAAQQFSSAANQAANYVTPLLSVRRPDGICDHLGNLETQISIKGTLKDISGNTASLTQLNVADVLTAIKQQSQVSDYVGKTNGLLIGIDAALINDLDNNDLTAAYNLYTTAPATIAAVVQTINTNTLLSDKQRSYLLAAAKNSASDVSTRGAASLGSNDAMLGVIMVRASNLLAQAQVDASNIPANEQNAWQDFAKRFQADLHLDWRQDLQLPDLRSQEEILAYDQKLARFSAEIKAFEVQP